MNRLSHLLRAKTQFSLHSPFVYRLYTEVLTSRCPGHGRSAADVLWRLEEYYGLPHSPLTTHHSPLITHHSSLTTHHSSLTTPDGLYLIVDHPHRDERRWKELVADERYQVTLDLFTVGIAIANPHLSKQHFILR